MTGKYANIAFNLPLNSLFTYSVPEELKEHLQIGARVLVQFGKRKITGVVIEFSDSSNLKKVLPVSEVLDSEPAVNEEMIKFCKWVSEYYFCPLGEVVFSALPKSILIESKIYYSVNKECAQLNSKLTEIQRKIVDLLKNKSLTVKQIENKLKLKSVRSAVNSLTLKGILKPEHITGKEKVKAKREKFIIFEMLDDFRGFSESMLENFLAENKIKSPKQIDIMQHLIKNKINEVHL
jgi:primosomal protein N' (replication factor Y) (superfamily II helicase)